MTISKIYKKKCNSKLNLYLHILDKKKNGFHNLETLFIPIDWYDEIIIQSIETDRILRKGDLSELKDKDLCFKAAKALKTLRAVKTGCEITLRKNIPSGAGLGGGSSNAASTLIILDKLWNLNLSKEELIGIGGKIGADIPFFLQKKPCFGSGIGTELRPTQKFTLFPKFFVLLVPDIKVDTGLIFGNFRFYRNERLKSKYSSEAFIKEEVGFWVYGRNDLEETTCRIFPKMTFFRETLRSSAKSLKIPPEACRMSGSGSTLFCSVPTSSLALDLEQSLREKLNGQSKVDFTIRICELIMTS
tara:strand:- start:13191 stop:14096 length:906 start_codon:yes stop_codon:yes gene_type:complete